MQINYLKEKLERQEKMVKFENNLSKIMNEVEVENGTECHHLVKSIYK